MSLFTVTVQPRECALVYRHGRLAEVISSGRHSRTWGARYVRVDLRDHLLTLSPQEVLTADGVTVKVTTAVRWSVSDPVAFVEQADDPVAQVYLGTQVALREALAVLDAQQVVRRGAAIPSAAILGAVQVGARTVGIEVTQVVVKDVILPAELRAAAAELVMARQRGAAQLEAARAETAALRSLANGARLLDAHPALAQLRLVQSAPTGTQLVLKVGAETPGASSEA